MHVALPLHMAEQQRIAQAADQDVGGIPARLVLQREDLAVQALVVGAERRQAMAMGGQAGLSAPRASRLAMLEPATRTSNATDQLSTWPARAVQMHVLFIDSIYNCI